ncbi:MAG: hypothetical protein LBR05_10530 [Azoarcus sp.]|jgi:hypothetical protein|nr:hypothetical protein [Azoarcus sp.]
MWPILPFLAGVAVGASALGFVRKAKNNPRLGEAVGNAERKLRRAAVSGLDVIRESSEQWRDRLADAKPAAKAAPAAPKAAPAARKPRAAKKAAPKQ